MAIIITRMFPMIVPWFSYDFPMSLFPSALAVLKTFRGFRDYKESGNSFQELFRGLRSGLHFVALFCFCMFWLVTYGLRPLPPAPDHCSLF